MSLVIDITCTGSHDKKKLVLNEGETVQIGRTNSEASLIVDARLSRKHFNIGYSQGKIEITHLSHTNPTLVASHGSSDFQKIHGVRTETNGCRIIAGSHRFELALGKPDSTALSGFSDSFPEEQAKPARQADIWSDDVPLPTGETSPQSGKTDSSVDVSPKRKPAKTVPIAPEDLPVESQIANPPPSQVVFYDEVSQSDPPAPPVKPREPEPAKEPERQSKKKPDSPKPFFPLSDDFFDD